MKVVEAIEAAAANLQVSIRCWQLTAKIFNHRVTCQFRSLDLTVSQTISDVTHRSTVEFLVGVMVDEVSLRGSAQEVTRKGLVPCRQRFSTLISNTQEKLNTVPKYHKGSQFAVARLE